MAEFVRASAQREVAEVERRLELLAAADEISAVARELETMGHPGEVSASPGLPAEPIFDESAARLDLDLVVAPRPTLTKPAPLPVEEAPPAKSDTARKVALCAGLVSLALAAYWLGPYRLIALLLFGSVCAVGVWLFRHQQRS